jgi:YcxB-like protein
MLSVKTKRYQLPTSTFIQIGFLAVIKRYWWAFLVPLAIALVGFALMDYWYWFVLGAVILTGLYLLFWYIQFYGITQLPQGKTLFEKYSYEFKNEHILIKKSEKEGMQLPWAQIKSVEMREDSLLLWIGRFQFFYIPFSIFTSDNDRKWLEAVFRRKKLLD